VDAYIAQAPKEWRGRLAALRAAIKSAAPGAEERVSYAIPYYHYKGRLVYFQLWKKHIGLYALTAPVLDKYAAELADYGTTKGTIRFPLDESLPVALIRRLVKEQVRRNDAAEKQK